MKEEDLLKLKQDLYRNEFKCKNCIDYQNSGLVCGQHRLACDPEEKACAFFIKSE